MRLAFLTPAFFSMLLLCGCGQGSTTIPTAASTGIVSGKVTYQGKPLPSGVMHAVSTKDPQLQDHCTILRDGAYKFSKAPVGPIKIVVDTSSARDEGRPYVAIPRKYMDFQQSDLSFHVKEGEQTHDIILP